MVLSEAGTPLGRSIRRLKMAFRWIGGGVIWKMGEEQDLLPQMDVAGLELPFSLSSYSASRAAEL